MGAGTDQAILRDRQARGDGLIIRVAARIVDANPHILDEFDEWDALQNAWKKNSAAQARAEKIFLLFAELSPPFRL